MTNNYENLDLPSVKAEEKEFMNRESVTRYFTMIFVAAIVGIVASFLVEIFKIFMLVEIVAYFVAARAMIGIGVSEKKQVSRYALAGISQIMSGVMIIVQNMMGIEISIPMIIVLAVVSFVGVFCEGQAYTETICRWDETMAEKWQKYLKLYSISIVGIVVMVIFVKLGATVIHPVGTLIYIGLMLVPLILFLVASIMRLVYLFKTIKCLKKQ